MRHVQEPACPPVLDGPDSPGAAETTRATKHYATVPAPTEAFTHRKYKDESVKERLTSAFEFMCAYCESYFGATQPVDIEHYRPKGKIATADGRTISPGYFWLAATWNNLLPSCVDCNRERQHKDHDGNVSKTGKGIHFPLVDESRRVTTAGADVSTEDPLLLHPYNDRPEDHLEFHESGVVQPSRDATRAGGEDIRGRATIDVTGLNRLHLVRARLAHAERVQMQLLRVAESESAIRRYPNDPFFRAQLRREIGELLKLKGPGVPYKTLTIQLVDRYRGTSS